MGFLAADDNYILGSVDEHVAILQTDQTILNTVTLYMAVNSGFSQSVDWGDGNIDTVVCDGTLKTLTHNYLATDTYSIRLAGDADQVTDFRAYSQSWIEGSILGFASLENLETLYLYGTAVTGAISILDDLTSLEKLNIASTSITGSLADITTLTALTELNVSTTTISGALSNLSTLTSLDDFQAQASSVSGDLTDLSPLTSATTLDVSGSSVSAYTTGALPAWAGCDIDISDLGLDSVEVDDFINDLNDGDGAGGTLTIDGTNAAHSTASDTGISELEANSWTITRNDYVVTSNQTGGLNTTTIRILSPTGDSLTIDWGDGNTTVTTCDDTLNVYTHDYAATERYGIHLTGDVSTLLKFHAYSQTWIEGDIANATQMSNITQFYLYSTGCSGALSGISTLTSIRQLKLYLTSVTGTIADLSGMTNMIDLQINNTSISGSISALSGMTTLQTIRLQSTSVSGALSNLSSLTTITSARFNTTSVSGDIADISSLSSLTLFYLYSSSVDTYTSGTLPAWSSADLRIQNLGLDSTEVDNFLIDLDAAGGSSGTLNIAGTNAARTSASDAAYASLVGKSWSITVN